MAIDIRIVTGVIEDDFEVRPEGKGYLLEGVIKVQYTEKAYRYITVQRWANSADKLKVSEYLTAGKLITVMGQSSVAEVEQDGKKIQVDVIRFAKFKLEGEGFCFVVQGGNLAIAEDALKYSPEGKPRLQTKIAYNSKPWTDKNGNEVKTTTWLQGTFFSEMAEKMAEDLTKGQYMVYAGEGEVRAYINNQGEAGANIQLSFIDQFQIGGLPKSGNGNASVGKYKVSNDADIEAALDAAFGPRVESVDGSGW